MTTKTKDLDVSKAVNPQVVGSSLQVMQQLRIALNQKYLERAALVDGVLVALISGEPLIIVGPPGTAKSAICNDVSAAISGRFFPWMLTKFTVPEELFGPLSLKALENDQYVRVTKDKLPEAHVGFLDEVGKASSSISNTLLTILNEKTFYNGGSPQKVPLRVLYGASNEVPASEELSAFYDRFVLRYFVDAIHEERNAKLLFGGMPQVQLPSLSLVDVDKLRADSEALPVPAATIDLMIRIRNEVRNEGIVVSDRKWVQAVRVAKAHAVLNGNKEVTPDDLEILCSVCWNTPDQIAKVRKIVTKISNPVNEKITALTDAMRQMVNDISKDNMIETFKKIQHANKQLKDIGDPSKNQKLADAIIWGNEQQMAIAKEHLGIA